MVTRHLFRRFLFLLVLFRFIWAGLRAKFGRAEAPLKLELTGGEDADNMTNLKRIDRIEEKRVAFRAPFPHQRSLSLFLFSQRPVEGST